MLDRSCFAANCWTELVQRIVTTMFSKFRPESDQTAQTGYAPPPDKTPNVATRRSVLNDGVTIRGDWTSDGVVEFGGSLVGDLTAEVLIISKTGKVIGNVRAKTVTVEGHLEGTVSATKVIIKPLASLKADIVAQDINLDPGAKIEGYLSIKPKTR